MRQLKVLLAAAACAALLAVAAARPPRHDDYDEYSQPGGGGFDDYLPGWPGDVYRPVPPRNHQPHDVPRPTPRPRSQSRDAPSDAPQGAKEPDLGECVLALIRKVLNMLKGRVDGGAPKRTAKRFG